jgi:hypothetical protein
MSALIPASQLPYALASLGASVVVAAVFLYVGVRLSQRVVSPGSRLASAQLSLWWAGLGVNVALTALDLTLAVLNVFSFPIALTLYLVTLLVDVAILWALTGFLVYVYTGKYHLAELGTLYAAFYVLVLYYVVTQGPARVVYQAGALAIGYNLPAIAWLSAVIIVLLIAPELIGAILYVSLVRRTRDHHQRIRIWLVGGGILLWILIDLVIPQSSPAWVVLHAALEIVPGIMSLFAFFPPVWVQRRFGVPGADLPADVAGR